MFNRGLNMFQKRGGEKIEEEVVTLKETMCFIWTRTYLSFVNRVLVIVY